MQEAEEAQKREVALKKKEKEEEAERKAENKERIKRDAKVKRDANSVVSLLGSAMLGMETAINTYLEDNVEDFKSQGSQLVLQEVRALVERANANIMGVGPHQDWDMARVRDLKGDMVNKTRTG